MVKNILRDEEKIRSLPEEFSDHSSLIEAITPAEAAQRSPLQYRPFDVLNDLRTRRQKRKATKPPLSKVVKKRRKKKKLAEKSRRKNWR